MTIEMFKSKLHMLTVTEADLYYEGSITIDEELLEIAQLLPYEKVQVVNVNNGSRLETYTIPGPRGSRVVCLNGPAARLNSPGDRIIVISYTHLTPEEARVHKPHIVIMNKDNEPARIVSESVYRENYAAEVGLAK
jgi:aspartate 1-decarboxylase